ncbi:Pr6Pr family membrane protein [Sphingobacterium griseoflavum]
MLLHREVLLVESLVRFFSYFTILTNILVALHFTAIGWAKPMRALNFVSNDSAATAICTFILTVGIVYQTVLKNLWQPQGIHFIVDQLLHGIIPLFMLGYWLLIIRSGKIEPSRVYRWLCYPILYLLFALTRGYFSGFYPYPFLNIEEIGFGTTLINVALISFGTIVMLALLITLGKWIQKKGLKTQ